MRSAQNPWVRGGLMGLVPLLLPFVWVLELDSCGNSLTTTEITGTMMFGKFDVEGWLVVVPVLLAVIVIPFLAPRIPKLGWRVVLHGLGFFAAFFAGYCAFFVMFFSLFTERMAKGAGWVVLGTFAASLLDALFRLIWSTQEWLRARSELSISGRPNQR